MNVFRQLVTKHFLVSTAFGGQKDGVRQHKKKQNLAPFQNKKIGSKQHSILEAMVREQAERLTNKQDLSAIRLDAIHLIDAIGWLMLDDSVQRMDQHLEGYKQEDLCFLQLEAQAVITHWLETLQWNADAEPVLAPYFYNPDPTSTLGQHWRTVLIGRQWAQQLTKEASISLEGCSSDFVQHLTERVYSEVVQPTVQSIKDTMANHLVSIDRKIIELGWYEVQTDEGLPIGRAVNKKNWKTRIEESPTNGSERALHHQPLSTSAKTFADLCCGVGGFRIALQEEGFRCVFSSDINAKSKETYFRNYGVVPFDDLSRYAKGSNALPPPPGYSKPDFDPALLLPQVDIFTGGFPCQPFSRAGSQQGFQDPRGNLFFAIYTLAKSLNPSVVLLENVSGITSVDNDDDEVDPGATLRTLTGHLFDLGFSNVQVRKLNAVHFKTPQKRVRLFFLASYRPVSLPHPRISKRLPTVQEHLTPKSGLNESFSLSKYLAFTHWLRAYKNKRKGKGFAFDVVDPRKSPTVTITARYYKDALECCVVCATEDWGTDEYKDSTWVDCVREFEAWSKQVPNFTNKTAKDIIQDLGIAEQTLKSTPSPLRFLTPRECARVFGYPDWFYPSLSNTQAYAQFGNSVAIPVVQYIAKRIQCSFQEKCSEEQNLHVSKSLVSFYKDHSTQQSLPLPLNSPNSRTKISMPSPRPCTPF